MEKRFIVIVRYCVRETVKGLLSNELKVCSASASADDQMLCI